MAIKREESDKPVLEKKKYQQPAIVEEAVFAKLQNTCSFAAGASRACNMNPQFGS